MRTLLCLFLIACAQVFAGAEVEALAQESPCPLITIRDKSGVALREGFIYTGVDKTLTADASGLRPEDKPTFNWTISSGKITEGQGTPTAKVSTDLDWGYEVTVTVTVEVGGVSALGPQCEKRASVTLRILEHFCPTLSISCPAGGQYGQPLTVSANVAGGDPEAEVKYNWMVSAGTIIAGQGTPSITVDTTGLGGQSVTATVEVGGFPTWCDHTESCSVIFESGPPLSQKFDSYGDLSRVNEEKRLAQFGEELRREPGAQGYIFYYGPRRVEERLSRAQKFLTSKSGIDPSRITAVNAGSRKKFAVQLWIRPTGAVEPEPDPRF